MIGGSYPGIVQLLAAIENPPHLVAIHPGVAPSGIYEQLIYQDGAFLQSLAQAWGASVALNEHHRNIRESANLTYWDWRIPPAQHPLLDLGSVGGLAPYYRDWIRHPTLDAYWKRWSFERMYDRIKVPVFHVGAWYDCFQAGTLRNYAGLRTQAGTAVARTGQRLLMMPGGHAGPEPQVGEMDFGPASPLPLWEMSLRWFDWHLKGLDNGMANERPVKLFVMGDNVYRDEDEWPLARAVPTRMYLRSQGKANSLAGDGRLSRDAPGAEPPDRFVYDPANPVPTHGGATLGIVSPGPGPRDQRVVEGRPDVLVYTSEALTEELEVTGPVSLEVYVSSSAVDTDLVGKLVDVWPDGRAINLTEGILRLRYRNSFEKPELMNPGQVYKVTLDLWSTANVFKPGHRLRLEVTSSSFPRFSRNLNHGGSPEKSSFSVIATNVIHHDADHPSALILPVVPR
jgi:putative CocE/NonD family hydrolase